MQHLKRSTRRLINIIHRLQRSLSRRGYLGSLRQAYRKFRLAATQGLAAPAREEAFGTDFDRTNHVETAKPVPMYQLGIRSRNWRFAVNYYPISPDEFREMLAAAGTDFSRFTFVDFGAGKGRALLIASEYPFAKIVGVEFAPELVEIARRNLSSYVGAPRRCTDIEVHCLDVIDFPIPGGPLVLYFYNPFEERVMARVVERVRRSLESDPREAIVIYNTPEHDNLWDGIEALKRVRAGGYSIYKTNG